MLEPLEEGAEIKEDSPSHTPKISGRILTSIDIETEIMRWELQKQEAADKRALSTIEKREQLERKLKEIRDKRETVQAVVQESERTRLELKQQHEEDMLQRILLREGTIEETDYLSGKKEKQDR